MGAGAQSSDKTVSARAVRWIANTVAALAIVGMIITSITDHVGAAITFGMFGAVATLCAIVATAVTRGRAVDEGQAERVESMIQQLVDAGADESSVRTLVGEAVKLGRTTL